METRISQSIGPVLIVDDIVQGVLRLSALFIAPAGETVPPLETATGEVEAGLLAEYATVKVYRARFDVSVEGPASYRWKDETYDIASGFGGDLRLAYVSCNGEETGDLSRAGSERNAMWARLCDAHRSRPVSLLLHGGDQVYADEVTKLHELSRGWPAEVPEEVCDHDLMDLHNTLREGFLQRYVALYRAPEFAWLAARVPSLMQWDDHDICDGWGSLPEAPTQSAVGQTLFAAAQEACLLFQHAAVAGDLPSRFADPSAQHLGWAVHTEGLRLVAPDLRSERTQQQILGQSGWDMMEAEAARHEPGQTLLLSSVPLLGPRLSLLERLLVAVPKLQKYEDDLRDQWQSHAHRDAWRRMLHLSRDMARLDNHSVTALSGEIHLATRAEMGVGDGIMLNQLVASGISHRPPPRAWARFLGMLAWLGEDPLPEHPIRIKSLPGQRHRYLAERNYLLLERQAGHWQARWELEESGITDPLAL